MLMNDKKKTIIGAAAAIIVAVTAVALSVYQFTAALNKNGVSDDSSLSIATNSHKAEPSSSSSTDTAQSIIVPGEDSTPDELLSAYGIDLSEIKQPLDLLENEAFMEKMMETGMSYEEIVAELEKLQERFAHDT